jgi:2,3-bisphosphoglycerate-independent phosphoglycerate mutase
VLFNFRGDRALELTRAFEQPEFDKFDRSPRPAVRYAGMMQYDGDLGLPTRFLVAPPAIDRTMGELLARAGRRQLAIAETHKFGHVTYFWNGNRSEPFDPTRERYIEVASDLAPLEQRPWMKCAEVTDALLEALREGIEGQPFDLVRLNYANGDMVGHTGDLRSTILAVEAVDLCLARLVAATRALEGVLLVTADHGNADQMFDGAGEQRAVRTSHSLNPVPLAIFDPREPDGGPALSLPERPGLSNLAATTLELLGFVAPDDYDPSLLAR